MLFPTAHTVDIELIDQALRLTNFDEFKLTINKPTGNFFYDPWDIKSEFKGTIWDRILQTLPEPKGEARIITLKPGTTYYCHADADDRWHLNLQSEHGYICDLENKELLKLNTDGIWYSMDAGRLHTAANFGNKDRIQLVVRQLLKRNQLIDPIKVSIVLKEQASDFRYQFDQTVSSWLNRANKNQIISDFVFSDNEIHFNLEKDYLLKLETVIPKIFKLVL